MPTLLALERYLPPFRYEQEEVTRWVREWLEEDASSSAARLLSVYASAGVKTRASVVPIEEVFHPRDFETQNNRYREIARRAATDLARGALERAGLLPREVDLVVSVSCTGFMIPALDAFVAATQHAVTGEVRLELSPGRCQATGRRAERALYRPDLATYEAGDAFDHEAGRGFVALWGLPARTWATVHGDG